jgi:hypothetical protein
VYVSGPEYSDVVRDSVLVYCEDDNDVVLHRRDLEYRAACTCGWRAETWQGARAPAESEGYDHAMTHAFV